MNFFKRYDYLALLALSVYFVQGFMVITGMAEFILTKNAFQFSWIQLALLTALGTLTWSIKPIYGFFTDLLPLFGSRRKYYLILSALFPIVGYFYLTFFGTSFLPIALAIIISNIGLGFADVIADGLVVERSTPETVGWYQALCWRSKAIGIFFASFFSGMILEKAVFSSQIQGTGFGNWLSETFSSAFPLVSPMEGIAMIDVRFTFLIAGLLPLITLIFALFLKEEKVTEKLEKKAHQEIPVSYVISAGFAFVLTAIVLIVLSAKENPLLSFLDNSALSSILVMLIWFVWIGSYAKHLINIKATTTTLIYAAVFIFLWRFTPSFGAPWSDYWINTLKVSQEKLGIMGTLQPLAWVIGSFLYVKFLDRFPLKKLLLWTVIISSTLGMLQLLVATPNIGNTIGEMFLIKYLAGILLFPSYFMAYGFDAWKEAMTQMPILNLDASLTFFLEIMFIVSFLPLLKLAAVVTPKGVEATNFAVLASIMNLGLAFGSISGGIIYTHIEGQHQLFSLTFTGLHLTIFIGAITSLLCLAVIRKLHISQ